jgi:peptide/nickel transport system substrate-binding protein
MAKPSALLPGLAILSAVIIAGPAAAENVVRFTGMDAGAGTLDPHVTTDPDNKGATRQVYEALLDIDSNLAIVPQLATAWEVVDLTNWEFELRPDVRFHDGTPFTAGDVIFSIERARAETSGFRDYVEGIAKVEAIDDHSIRFTTTEPDPSLWLKLAEIAVMSKSWTEEHDTTMPAFGEGYASRHANGTGPFLVEAFEPRGRYALVRNPDWWGAAEYPHDVDRIVHVPRGEDGNLVALLAGEIDLLQGPPYTALDQIRGTPDLKLVHRPKLHTMFFGFDQGSSELRSSDIKGRNPFQDKRVRQAIAHALDIEPILRHLMGEMFAPAGMIAAPGVNGYSAELDQTTPYNPEKARALLAAAGYPDGFNVTLDCANDWGDDEIATCKGAVEQLGAVGIEVAVNWLSTDAFLAKVERDRRSNFWLDGFHMEPDSERVLREMFHSQGQRNAAGYANPRVDELIGKAEVDMVTYARDAYLEEAWQIVTDDLVYLPVRHGVSVFALREELEIPPDPWDIPRFRLARFKEIGG